MAKVITIVDTFGFFFRSFYALPPLSSSSGFPTGLLTGFSNFIATLHKEHSSDYIVFALDSKGDCFRKEIDPNYKANRQAPPEELTLQLPIAIEWVEKMGFQTRSKTGYEADDVIASLTKKAVEAGHLVRIVSHDKDLYQLIEDDKVVLVDPIKKSEVNAQRCFEKYGVHPHQIVDFLSLIGDSSDNVPGVKGIGEKSAQKLLSEYGSLNAIYENIDTVTTARFQKLLREGQESAFLSQKLITLDDSLYDSLEFEVFGMHDEFPFLRIYDELKKYDMNAILRIIHAKGLMHQETPSPEKEQCSTVKTDVHYELIDSDTVLLESVKAIKKGTLVAFDTETTGLDVNKDTIVGFSFCIDETTAYYVPIAHEYLGVGAQVSPDAAKEAIKILFTHTVIGHNIKYDLHIVTRFVESLEVTSVADTIVLAWLLAPESQLSLDKLVDAKLNHKMIAYSDVVPKKSTFAQVALEDALAYAAEDALYTYKLYHVLLGEFKSKSCVYMLEIATNYEFPYLLTLLAMEKEGIRIDVGYLASLKSQIEEIIASLSADIYRCSGSEFNINSTKQLGVILFETLQLPVVKKTKTGYSTDESVLSALEDEHEVVKYIIQYREVQKLYSTYIEPLLQYAQQDANHRVYTSFIHTGTATGRLSSKNPNLQNIPVKTELGRKIRQAFIAKEGYTLVGIDYSQIELRLLAHFSKDSVLVDAFRHDKDIHTQTATVLFGQEEAEKKRSIAKTVNFGLLYGMGQRRLAQTLGIDQKEAKEIIERYFENFPSVKNYFSQVVKEAKERGYVETLLGRRRYFDFAGARPVQNAAYEREAVNTIFQGSAADLIKLSMNSIEMLITQEGLDASMLLQIHDELIFEVREAEATTVGERFKSIMEEITPLSIPLKASLNIGVNWAQLK